MKNTKVIALILTGAGIFLWWTLSNDEAALPQQPIFDSSEETIQSKKDKQKKFLANKNLTVSNEKIEEKKPTETTDSSLTTSEDLQPFNGISRPSDEAQAILEEAGVLPQDLKGESYVEFDLDSLRRLDVGDTFNLEIPQTSEMFSAEVTKVDNFDNGDKSVFGRLVGSDGAMHTTVLTVGADALYGQFTTASGNYVFESKGKHGWLAAKRDLYKSHVEFEAVQMDTSTDDSIEVIAPEGTKE